MTSAQLSIISLKDIFSVPMSIVTLPQSGLRVDASFRYAMTSFTPMGSVRVSTFWGDHDGEFLAKISDNLKAGTA